MVRAVVAAVFLLLAPVASAQVVPGPMVEEPVTQSVLPNLFATSLGLTIEVRVDYSDIDNVDLTILNTFARVQYLTYQGFGGYASIPYAYLEDDEEQLFGGGGSGIGNLEVGGLYVTPLSPKSDLLLRGGVAIDTTAEDDDLAVSISTLLPRLVDVYPSSLQTTWGRAQGQLRHASGNLRLGAAVGFDVPLAGEGADQDGFTGVINGVLAAGMQQNNLGIGVSFVMVQPLTDTDDENVTGLVLGGDYLLNPTARIFFQLSFSLEDNGGGNAIGFGVRSTIASI